MSKIYKTGESVCVRHPNRLCDLIADNILDACLRKDKTSHVACEFMATKDKIIVVGEIICSKIMDIRKNYVCTVQSTPTQQLIGISTQVCSRGRISICTQS